MKDKYGEASPNEKYGMTVEGALKSHICVSCKVPVKNEDGTDDKEMLPSHFYVDQYYLNGLCYNCIVRMDGEQVDEPLGGGAMSKYDVYAEAFQIEEFGISLEEALETGVCVDCKKLVIANNDFIPDMVPTDSAILEYRNSGHCYHCAPKVEISFVGEPLGAPEMKRKIGWLSNFWHYLKILLIIFFFACAIYGIFNGEVSAPW